MRAGWQQALGATASCYLASARARAHICLYVCIHVYICIYICTLCGTDRSTLPGRSRAPSGKPTLARSQRPRPSPRRQEPGRRGAGPLHAGRGGLPAQARDAARDAPGERNGTCRARLAGGAGRSESRADRRSPVRRGRRERSSGRGCLEGGPCARDPRRTPGCRLFGLTDYPNCREMSCQSVGCARKIMLLLYH